MCVCLPIGLCVCVFMGLVACNKLIDWLIDWPIPSQTFTPAVTFQFFTLVPNHTAWWQRQKGVNYLSKAVMQPCLTRWSENLLLVSLMFCYQQHHAGICTQISSHHLRNHKSTFCETIHYVKGYKQEEADNTENKKLRYHEDVEEHSASVVLSWCTEKKNYWIMLLKQTKLYLLIDNTTCYVFKLAHQ